MQTSTLMKIGQVVRSYSDSANWFTRMTLSKKRADDPEFDPLLPPKDAAKYLGVSVRTLRRLALAKQQRGSTTSRNVGYRLSALNAYLDRNAEDDS
ncbi:MAG TPA: helix-turn-helix domain-containing protein [Gemmatimonadaceae bacterium]|jgi:hypothetical protein